MQLEDDIELYTSALGTIKNASELVNLISMRLLRIDEKFDAENFILKMRHRCRW